MKIVSWNVRGLGSVSRKAAVKELLFKYRPDVAGFQETKTKNWDPVQLRYICGGGVSLDSFEFVSSIGNSGGLLTCWDSSNFKCSQTLKDKYFSVVLGNWVGVDGTVGLVNIYGPNSVSDRKDLWTKLLAVLSNEEIKWCIFGDFNEVRSVDERLNSCCNQGGMDDFNRFIEDGGLVEIPLIGRRFTRISDDGIKFSKLDRFLSNQSFVSSWKLLGVRALERKGSDHMPLMLSEDLKDFGPKPFKFFNAWLSEDSLEAIVRESWNCEVRSSDPDRVLRDKFKQAKVKIKAWSVEHFGALENKIVGARNECNNLEAKAEQSGWSDREREKWLESRKRWLDLEEKKSGILRQKAKLKWLLEGDENSKFFHTTIKFREKKNAMRGLEVNGEWVEDPERLKLHVFNFFKNKFSRDLEEKPSFNSSKTKKISRDDAIFLEAPFDEAEVWNAIRDCGSSKSPGPDGFSFGFVKKFWEVLKEDFMKALRWFWEKEALGPGCNASFVSLIPKVATPLSLNDYRPISLIGVLYKVIAKVLAHRLKKVIGKVISDPQSAFIKGRNILDGVLIANEVVDFVRFKKRKGLIFKVDFEKAYDSVDWNFLLGTMNRMGFGKKWIGWISACLRSSSTSVLVNGSPSKEFMMEKGLRQGDPLAPFLFLIVAENLHLLVEEAKDKSLFEGLSIGNEGIEVSHLQYADDAIFFVKWSLRNLRNLIKILDCFHAISGLKINMRKSKIYGVGVQEAEVEDWARGVGCVGGALPFSYLGLPVGAVMSRKSYWRPVIEKVKSRLVSWKARMISFGGRLTLVKSVLDGGSFWGRIIRSIYGDEGGLGLRESEIRGGGCSVWKNIVRVGGLLDGMGLEFSNSFRKIVGDGSETRFWKDRWLGDRPLEVDFPRISRLEVNSGVSILDRGEWVEDTWEWKWSWSRVPRGRALGELENLVSRLNGWNPIRNKKDVWGWDFDLANGFSVQKLREILAESSVTGVGGRGTMWAPFVPKKVNVFIWRLNLGRIPTRETLDKMGIDLHTVLCPRCGESIEDLDHALFKCSEVNRLWMRVGNWWNKPLSGIHSVAQLIQEDGQPSLSDGSNNLLKLMYCGWRYFDCEGVDLAAVSTPTRSRRVFAAPLFLLSSPNDLSFCCSTEIGGYSRVRSAAVRGVLVSFDEFLIASTRGLLTQIRSVFLFVDNLLNAVVGCVCLVFGWENVCSIGFGSFCFVVLLGVVSVVWIVVVFGDSLSLLYLGLC
ncbi:hypothetical protein OSB04_026115 [Centaurea solstitialis]|uniref:Reverse transcriptase domain-containing protein n=1 Tax=Centaurea solstitialis TaxID=347529 RepID=A0AA38SAU8_9ASTR|nr:hypothetical protein OSB04_026115 [Centaurea solstitialis]